ncbi:MAG TPA: class I SAM-dependent methyltransferase [Dehalococcoidia bacterium]|nr:class I SAM-dependent methyltransferase [Dehalococcoidia bacterium]
MPSLDWNLSHWAKNYDWGQSGDEWSDKWGTTEQEWQSVLWPRIKDFVPTGTILEIAPGYGRWTEYLKDLCQHLVIVDLAPNCIEACRERFKDATNIDYHVNDGKDLSMVEDGSIDFAFSFDSLVHVEIDVIEAYVSQVAKKLKPNGIAFFHHSNIGEYKTFYAISRRITRGRRFFGKLGLYARHDFRAFSVTAAKFQELVEQAGMRCVLQEKVAWILPGKLTDCFSTFCKADAPLSGPNRISTKSNFVLDAQRAAQRVLGRPT